MARRDTDDSHRKGTARAAQLARARLLIKAHLGWLGGYPEEVGAGVVTWTGARVERIDRAAISESTRAFKQLIGEHAKVLPAAVGDVKAWDAGVTRALEALKRAVHGGELGSIRDGATGRAADELSAALPELEPVVDALTWIRVGDPAALRRDLRWVSEVSDALVEVLRRSDVAHVLDLVRLAEEESPRKVAPLVAMLGDPAVHDTVTEGPGFATTVLQRIGNPELEVPKDRPTGKLGKTLLTLPGWLRLASADERKGALRAIAALELPDFVARWADVWVHVDRELARHGDGAWDELKTNYDRLKAAIGRAPGPIGARALFEAILAAAKRPRVLDVLEALPGGDVPPARPVALVRMSALHETLDPPEEAAFLDLLRAYLGARGDRYAKWWYAPVDELLDPGRNGTLARLARTLRDATHWRKLGQALILAAHSEPRALDAPALDSLAALVRVGSPEDALEGLRLLRTRHLALDAITADAASRLTDTPGDLVALADVLRAVTDGAATAIVALAPACGPGAAALVRRLLERGERQRLIDGAAQLDLADSIKLRRRPMLVAPDGDVPPWGTALPDALQEPLARLCGAGGEAAARKILAETFPDADALDAEIRAIEKKLAGSDGEAARRLANRLGNLRRKLDTPKLPSAARVQNLANELSEAADVTAFERWRAALAARLDAAMPEVLDLDVAPAWLSAPDYRGVILGITGLNGAPRKLAHRVLSARCGPPPWDLRDDPANRAFVTRIRRLGIDPAPWVDGIGVRMIGEYAVSLEDDPLEVLRMGAHFTTCLAPGAINFFAAVVNAADINKRVIYARDADGSVRGRCLIALTDSGGILAFHPYCHDDEHDFTATVRELVVELAAKMGTVLLPTGSVSTLLETRWYDDGPEDLTGQFHFLLEGSAFRTRLATIPIDELVPALTAQFAPLPLGGHTLGLIIGLSELDNRPALIVPLMPLIDERTDVPLEIRLRAAELATRAGRADLAAARLGPDLDAHARALARQHRHVDRELLEKLVVASPSRALAFVRDTRERGVRTYLDERDPARLWAAARGHELLGRPRQATALFRRTMELHRGLREACEQRLGSLGAHAHDR